MKIIRNLLLPGVFIFLPIFAFNCELENLLLISSSDCVISRFDANKSECTAPCTINFQNTSINAITWSWEFNGSSSKEKNPEYTFTEPGEYPMKLVTWRYHEDKLCIDTTQQVININ